MCLLALAVACDDDGDEPEASPSPAVTATAAPTATPPPDIAAQIGVRGIMPENDPIDLAARFGLTDGRAPEALDPGPELAVGSAREFFVLQLSGAAISGDIPPVTRTITATLRAKSEHAYFYVEDALEISQADIDRAATVFEGSTWPAVTSVFGEPAVPGVDGDPHIIVVQADLGGAVGGYHSGDDAYLRAVRRYSNVGEIVYMDRTLVAGGGAFNVVLAHELQHLIHSHNDNGEEAWVNEGLSETASGLVGGALSSVDAFAGRPETQLNAWSSEGSLAHYGAGAAFFRYLAARFGGDQVLGDAAREPRDGAAGVEDLLAALGQALAFDAIFADWAAANVLDEPEGPYHAGPSGPAVAIDFSLAVGVASNETATQFGADYYALQDLAGEYVLRFEGEPAVSVFAGQALPGAPLTAWWGNAQDSIDTRLTSPPIDLADIDDPTLTFRSWFDIEPWFDWGYVAVSDDGGVTWSALAGTATTSDDPVGAAYGPGYTGTSGGAEPGGWIEERVSLEAYAGRTVLLRFEYVTDGATYRDGWAIDGVQLGGTPLDLASWANEGWVRIDEPLPQTYLVRLIAEDADGAAVVRDMTVGGDGRGELRFSADGLRDVVVAVAGTTEGTTQMSDYRIELARP